MTLATKPITEPRGRLTEATETNSRAQQLAAQWWHETECARGLLRLTEDAPGEVSWVERYRGNEEILRALQHALQQAIDAGDELEELSYQ